MSLEVNIKKKYPSFTLDVAFTAGDETLGFLGASGCGKSLTMRCIAGIETPDEGRIVVNDQVFFDSAQRVNLTPQKRKTALLFQSYMLFPNLTVAENVGAGIERAVPRGVRDAIVATELKRFGLEGFDKRYPAQLSGGQQQRVALARMLAARPGILMLDEPFSALDAHLKGVLEQNLVSLFDAYDGTILYVSHDIDEALRFCDRIAVVEAGRIMETGTGDDLVNRPQSLAGVKLSGCKNATPAERMGEHRVRLPKWGIEAADRRAGARGRHPPRRARVLPRARVRPRRELLPGARRPRERLALRPHGASGLPRPRPGRGAHRERRRGRDEVPAPASVLARGQAEGRPRRAALRGRRALDPHPARQGVPGVAVALLRARSRPLDCLSQSRILGL